MLFLRVPASTLIEVTVVLLSKVGEAVRSTCHVTPQLLSLTSINCRIGLISSAVANDIVIFVGFESVGDQNSQNIATGKAAAPA